MLSSAELIRVFSLREWAALCNLLDTFGPRTQTLHCTIYGNEDGAQHVHGKLQEKKFSVLKVVRETGRLRVLCDLGRGNICWYKVPNHQTLVAKSKAGVAA